MNIRRKTEQEIVRNLDSMSLSEIYLNSAASGAETNLILSKILNTQHCLKVVQNKSNSCLIHQISEAA